VRNPLAHIFLAVALQDVDQRGGGLALTTDQHQGHLVHQLVGGEVVVGEKLEEVGAGEGDAAAIRRDGLGYTGRSHGHHSIPPF